MHINNLSKEISNMSIVAKERLTQLRLITNEKINKTRIKKTFNINDYVFVKDRYIIPGNPRPLHTKLHPSPYIVVRPLWSTTLVKRLADGFTTLYSNDDLKRYDGGSPLFKDLPPEISRVLLHSFTDLLESDLSTITQHDNLSIPTGIQLFDPLDSTKETQAFNPDHNTINYPVDTQPMDLVDEFEPKNVQIYNYPDENVNSPTELPATITDENLTGNLDDSPEFNNLMDQIKHEQLLKDLQELETSDISHNKNQNNIQSDSDTSDDDLDYQNSGMKLRSGRKKVHFSKS